MSAVVHAGDVRLAWRLEELHDHDDTSGGFTSERAAPQSRYPPNDDGDSAVAYGTNARSGEALR